MNVSCGFITPHPSPLPQGERDGLVQRLGDYQILHAPLSQHRPGLTAPDRPARLLRRHGCLIIQRFDPEFVGSEQVFQQLCIGTFPDGKRDGS